MIFFYFLQQEIGEVPSNGCARKSSKLLNLGRPVPVYPWITGSVEHHLSLTRTHLNLSTCSLPLLFAPWLQKLKFLVTEKPHCVSLWAPWNQINSLNPENLFLSMATSLICHLSAPPSSLATDICQGRQAASPLVPNTFLHGTNIFSAPPRRLAAQRSFKSVASMASDHVPKQFRQENLKDGCESWLLSFSPFFFIHFRR